MNLFLLRHGLAVERTIPSFKLDSDRPLTPEGRKKVARVAAFLGQLEVSFDRIVASSHVRARQTAEIVAEAMSFPEPVEVSKHLTPGSAPKPLIEELQHPRRPLNAILLVGHEPDLSRLISILVTGKPGLAVELKKGGLCKLEIAALRYGRCAALQWLLAPKLCP